MRRPGVEPGSTAWKATMLTVTPPTHTLLYTILFFDACVGYKDRSRPTEGWDCFLTQNVPGLVLDKNMQKQNVYGARKTFFYKSKTK
jgi:hypothetical protein